MKTCNHHWDGPPINTVSPLKKAYHRALDSFIVTEEEMNRLPGSTQQEKFYALDTRLRELGYYVSGGSITCSVCSIAYQPNLEK